jgi:hypothetical protein
VAEVAAAAVEVLAMVAEVVAPVVEVLATVAEVLAQVEVPATVEVLDTPAGSDRAATAPVPPTASQRRTPVWRGHWPAVVLQSPRNVALRRHARAEPRWPEP